MNKLTHRRSPEVVAALLDAACTPVALSVMMPALAAVLGNE